MSSKSSKSSKKSMRTMSSKKFMKSKRFGKSMNCALWIPRKFQKYRVKLKALDATVLDDISKATQGASQPAHGLGSLVADAGSGRGTRMLQMKDLTSKVIAKAPHRLPFIIFTFD